MLDHVRAMERTLLGEPVSVWPCASLSRVVQEGAVRVCHMYGADLSSEERAARIAAAWLGGVQQHLTAAREFNPTITLPEAEAAWEKASGVVASAGMTLEHGKKGNRVVSVRLEESAAALALNFVDAVRDRPSQVPSWYRTSSGASHSTLWLIQQAAGLEDDGTPAFRASADIITAATLAVLGTFEDVTQTLGTYFGRDPQEAVRTVKRRTVAVLDRQAKWARRSASADG
ncbi:hypothetical protein [Streptomyces capparidis]